MPPNISPIMADRDTDPPLETTATRDHAPTTAPNSNSPTPSETRRSSVSAAGMSQSGRLPDRAAADDPTRRPRPRPLNYGSINASTSTLARPASNQPQASPSTPKRPGAIKRQTSSAAPHRGQEFSVDDDIDEVDKDLQLARTHTKGGSGSEGPAHRSLRRRESTLRRRPTGAAKPLLRTVESEEGEEEGGGRATVSGSDAVMQMEGQGGPSSEETLREEEEAVGLGMEEVETPMEDEEAEDADDDDDGGGVEEEEEHEEDEDELSDTDSFTLKDRQEAINETHPFGIRIWKPALYKKKRSVQRNAEGDIHSAPGGNVGRFLSIFNVLWTLLFGWWLCILAGVGGIVCMILSLASIEGTGEYGRVLLNLAHYLWFPFGKYVKLERDETYAEEDEGEGRSISEYERWQTGDLEEGRLFFGPTNIDRSIIGRRRDDVDDDVDETDSLLGRDNRHHARRGSDTTARIRTKKRLFGRGKWNFGRVIFFLCFYGIITPALFLVSGLCWFLVFTIPMGKVTLLLFYHLRRHPLALSFHTDSHYLRQPPVSGPGAASHSILLCTYRAVGTKYWKYTIDGTNIFLINLLGLVVFAIFDYFVLYSALGIRMWFTSPGLVFILSLASIIPLAYFIGQAVASISAQSSMGVGATINAFFSTVVEVFLYCVALKEGKAPLVEGSIIGSIFAGILFLPGLSMCFGALKRKTQRFNVKSAGVTSTMLLFAVIGAFGPTLFYQIYGSHEMRCHQCVEVETHLHGVDRDCRRCFFSQVPAVHDKFYLQAVRPYIWFASVCLVGSYAIGLLFTLRTHAAVIWRNEEEEHREKKEAKADVALTGLAGEGIRPGKISRGETTATMGTLTGKGDIRESGMYKRILHQSLRQAGVAKLPQSPIVDTDGAGNHSPYMVPTAGETGSIKSVKLQPRIHGLSAEDNRVLVQQVAEMAATAATVAARDAVTSVQGKPTPKRVGSVRHQHTSSRDLKDGDTHAAEPEAHPAVVAEEPGGHDAPNWSRTKSAVILLTATLAYAIIAEILVDTVDSVLSNIDISEKFLGITLFALVPNTTEFLNAISFATHGNVALSMEIGSSYALQVMLLQIPCLVLFSAFYGHYFLDQADVIDHTFTMIFPQWDMVTVILGVFLMGWVVGEGKSNYFKGSMLVLSYGVVMVGFWFSGYDSMAGGEDGTRGVVVDGRGRVIAM